MNFWKGREKEKPMKYKSIFLSDIDGTLTDENFKIHPGVVKAAGDYVKSGGLLVLSTGRAPIAAEAVVRTMNITHPCIVYSGAGIYDFIQGRLIWSHPMEDKILGAVEYVLGKYPAVSVQIFTDRGIYLLRSNETLDKKAVRAERGERISDIASVKGRILKILLTGEDRRDLEECGRHAVWKGTTFQFASRHFAEIVDENTDKCVAMERLIRLFDMEGRQSFAAGDAMTDYTMLAHSKFSFVPSQAPEELKKAGKMIIAPPGNGGMETAFRLAQKYNVEGEKLWEKQLS